MHRESLALFIYEASLLKDIEFFYTKRDYRISYPFGPRILDDELITTLNNFIEKIYQINKELLKVLFIKFPLLEVFIQKGYDVIDYHETIKILSEYCGIEGYAKLVELVGPERNKELNKLVIAFLQYYNEIIELANYEYSGYQKILQ